MSFPLACDGRAVNSRWGPRWWNGVERNHNGIDQALASGTEVVVEHAGILAGPARHVLDNGTVGTLGGVGRDRIYGHYAMYQVTPDLRVSYHQLRAAGRGAQRLIPGETVIGLVGNPLVSIPLTERRGRGDWSGVEAGLSDRSGSHLHTQGWERGEDGIYRPINPDDDWVSGQLSKTTTAGSTGSPLEEDFMAGLSDKEQREVHTWLGQLRTLVGGTTADKDGDGKQDEPGIIGRLRGLESRTATVQGDTNRLVKRVGGSTTGRTLTALLGDTSPVVIDPAEWAGAIAAELDDLPAADASAVASAVVGLLSERLKS